MSINQFSSMLRRRVPGAVAPSFIHHTGGVYYLYFTARPAAPVVDFCILALGSVRFIIG